MKVTFYYVRHGETLFNDLRIMQGKCDSPLTVKGIEQAEETASVLRYVHFDHVFCSSSERAWDTAQMICRYHDNEPVCLKELKEFDFGELDGEPIDRYYSLIQPHRIEDDWTDIGGENVPLFIERADKGFARMLSMCRDGDTVLMVSHGSFFAHLLKTHFVNIDQQEYIARKHSEKKPFIPNCGIAVFTYEDGVYRLVSEPQTAGEFRRNEEKTVHFVYIRHGETVFNVQKRLQGFCDSPLTDKGIQQAEERAKKLKDMHFDCAYVSSTERTRDTAEILLKGHGLTAIPDKRLREVCFGDLESQKYESIWDTIYPMHMLNDWSKVKGEDYEDLKKRLHAFLRDSIDAAKDGDTILLVSHGDLYMVLLQYLFGIHKEELYQKANEAGKNPAGNCGMFRFSWQNGTFTYEKLMHEEEE